MDLTGALTPPGADRVRTLEDHFGVRFPAAYTEFLGRHNGARVDPGSAGLPLVPTAALFGGDMLVLDYRDATHDPPVGRWDHEASDDFHPVVRPVVPRFAGLVPRVAEPGLTGHDVAVLGSTMHYVAGGDGPAVVFLHGNPTSSHLWRGVLPRLQAGRRLIAVDLIGMGASGKPDIDYTLPQHIAHVEGFLDALGLHDVVLVAHDWGVAICLDILRRRPGLVTGVAVMEGHLRPIPGWADFDPGGRALFQQLREPGTGERMALDENFLIDTLLPGAVRGGLAAADLEVYRRPYPSRASRRPLLQWTREIPIGGHPAHSVAILDQAWEHLRVSPVPKLLVHADPGAVVTAGTVALCRSMLPDLTVHSVGAGAHFLPEEHPAGVADALARWLPSPSPHR